MRLVLVVAVLLISPASPTTEEVEQVSPRQGLQNAGCASGAGYSRVVSRQEVAAILMGRKMQGLAKKIADDLAAALADVDGRDPRLTQNRVANLFREQLHMQASHLSGELTPVLGWTASMQLADLLSCFPDFAVLWRSIEQRVEAAQQQFNEQQQRQQRLEQTPIYLLGNSYLNYLRLKKCESWRMDYATIFISEAEMERARLAVKKIEEKIAPFLGTDEKGNTWTTETMWREANRMSANDRDPDRYSCQLQYRALVARYLSLFPEDDRIQKDF
jgi:hypothetical protein